MPQEYFARSVLDRVHELGGTTRTDANETLASPGNQTEEGVPCGIGTSMQRANGTQRKNRCTFYAFRRYVCG